MAARVLETRRDHHDYTLNRLYGPICIPPELVKAHRDLDAAVLAAYGIKEKDPDNTTIVAKLFEKYNRLMGLPKTEAETNGG
jgi:hypothetical protein